MTSTQPSETHNDGDHDTDVCVIGGGLAGLTAAATAARPGARVTLLDAHAPGGRARVDDVGGFRFNRGPRALYLGGAGQEILTGLGLALSGGVPPVKGGMGSKGGALSLLPADTMSTMRSNLLSFRGAMGLGRSQLLMRRAKDAGLARLDGLTVNEWLAEIHLPADTAEFVRAIIRLSTYIDAPDHLSAATAIGQVSMAVKEGVRYLDGGFGSIVNALAGAAQAEGAMVLSGADAAVQAVTVGVDGVARVATSGGTITADSVIIAAGSPAVAARLFPALEAELPTADTVGPPVTAACLELGVRTPPRHRFIIGIDEPLYLSTHCPPADLAPEGQAVVHVMAYHPPFAAEAPDPDTDRDRLLRLAQQAGIQSADIVEQRFLAKMVVSSTVPMAATGGQTGRLSVANPARPGVLLAGDWVGPRGLLADAAMASGAEAGALAAAAVRTGRVRACP